VRAELQWWCRVAEEQRFLFRGAEVEMQSAGVEVLLRCRGAEVRGDADVLVRDPVVQSCIGTEVQRC
jgi:hypothetical protein